VIDSCFRRYRNIQALTADLQAANLGYVTPAANHDDSSFTNSESERQKPRRNSKKKSSTKKKKKQKTKRMKYSKRSQHKNIRSPDQGDELSSSSDDSSSSSSSSDDDSNSTSDNSQESILAFGKRGSMKNTNDQRKEAFQHIKTHRKTSKEIGSSSKDV
jgi:hypothetical protein